ncbi:Coenzyme F420 hydrogenase/dehydrogenase, beta subunit C-terminal domain [Paenirhodobacter populi]|uniref:Coenzyme F420 hydrogenase n=1 Tax=Paenirhodobacter populi TaxID=2306993 RepID=A0A443IP01_9RHOB|nr:Coenzyme F420 hydrogenase/dehydrogenase, beta subunit C-terminal domain [Sinirhodobacter populi]RWR08146.1 coenzyme F420 hydrogenase [Sinirhodobacter populi]
MASIEQVIRERMCSGCGACQFAAPDLFRMEENADGYLQANKISDAEEPAELRRICPFSGERLSETVIAERQWPDLPVNSQIGRHARSIVCHATDEKLRMAGGSGGLVTWIALELLRRGLVDGVLHVQPVSTHASTPAGRLFNYSVSTSAEEVRAGSKSRYYSVTLADVLTEIRSRPGRFAVIGVPCFITAARLLVEEGQIERDRVPYMIGLVCGHMKSRYFADYLAWQKGVTPGTLDGFDFRQKLLDRPASNYGFRLHTPDRDEVYPMKSVRGRDWGEGLFKLPACEYCDDVLAECADAAIGDAWLPGYVADPRGTNVAVIRHPDIVAIIAEEQGRSLHVEDVSVEAVIRSQRSGLRHRREGLAHRLARRAAEGLWIPEKRVSPALAKGRLRRRIYDLRLKIANESNAMFADAVKAGDLNVFEKRMDPILRDLRHATQGGYIKIMLRKGLQHYRRLRHRLGR